MKHVIFLITIFFLINIKISSQTADAPTIGNGSEGSPYEIATLNNLYWIAENSSRWEYHYIQTVNIDASATSGWAGGGWTPIGNDVTKFSGFYDGQGYTITGLYIDRSGSNNQGLFGHVGHNTEATEIKDLGLTNVEITGARGVGALIGRVTGNANTIIENCYVNIGTITGDGATGGLIGSHNGWQETPGGTDNPILRYSYANVSVNLSATAPGDKDKFGGLVGCTQKGTILNCYARGTVTNTNGERIGGLAGCANLIGVVTNSYSTGFVDVTNCTLYGGLIGNIGTGGNAGIITNCYWDTETSQQASSAAGVGKTTAEMKQINTFDPEWIILSLADRNNLTGGAALEFIFDDEDYVETDFYPGETTLGQTFTWSMWKYYYDFEISKGASGVLGLNPRFYTQIMNASGVLRIALGDSFWNTTTLGVENLNNWFLISFVFDEGTVYTYVNDVLEHTQLGVTFSGDSPNPLALGRGYDTNRWHDGLIDDVRMYNRALGAAGIDSIYNKEEITENLIAHWRLDEKKNSIAYDNENNNDGEIFGAKWYPVWYIVEGEAYPKLNRDFFQPDDPKITTLAATNIEETSVTLNGELESMGTFTPVDVFFQYRESGESEWLETNPKEELLAAQVFDFELVGLVFQTTYEFRAVAEYSGSFAYGEILNFTTTAFGNFTWNGSVSNEWENPNNWTLTPNGAERNMLIPNGIATYPRIIYDETVTSVTIESEASLLIAVVFPDQKGSLTVTGTMTNDGTINIWSRNFGDASLIADTYAGSGEVNIERHLSENQWHNVTSPITDGLTGVFESLWLITWEEDIHDFGPYITSTTDSLPVGKGYFVRSTTNTTRTFTGAPNNGVIGPLEIQRDFEGFNLIGNPYTSAIDWNAPSGWTRNNIATSIYIWDQNEGNYAVYNSTGPASLHGGSNFIAMGQGFFVQATGNNANITMNNEIRVHNPVGFKSTDNNNEIRIYVSNNVNSYTDETLIVINEDAPENYDIYYDSYKLLGEETAPMLYTINDDVNLSVSVHPELSNIFDKDVFFRPGVVAAYTINFNYSLDGGNSDIYLYDKVTQELIENGQNYTFNATPGDAENRFMIASIPTTSKEFSLNNIQINSYNKTLYVNTENQLLENIEIYSIEGRKIKESKTNTTDLNHLPSGIYIVRVKTNENIKTEKIAIY